MSAGRPYRRSIARGRAIVLSARIRDDASHREKEGAMRRRLVASTGRCPCGAVLTVPEDLVAGEMTVIAVEHENDCPAIEVER